MKNSKVIMKLSLVFTLFLSLLFASSNIASAELPEKDPNQYWYDLYAPKTQTTYKKFSTVSQPVSTIKRNNEDLMIYGGILAGGGTFAALFKSLEKVPYVGIGIKTITGTGSAMVVVGSFGTLKYRDFQDDAIVKHVSYFKWTNAKRLEYSVKIESYVEYKGTRISEKEITYFEKTL